MCFHLQVACKLTICSSVRCRVFNSKRSESISAVSCANTRHKILSVNISGKAMTEVVRCRHLSISRLRPQWQHAKCGSNSFYCKFFIINNYSILISFEFFPTLRSCMSCSSSSVISFITACFSAVVQKPASLIDFVFFQSFFSSNSLRQSPAHVVACR